MSELAIDDVVVVVRLRDPEDAYVACSALIDGGVRSVEVTMTVPGAVELIERLRPTGAFIGAGTILEPASVAEVVAAGARYIVAPDTRPDVMHAAQSAGVPIVPGALSPTEINQALVLGAAAVKVFPVDMVGGPDYIAALRGPLPDVPLVVSGGVTIEAARKYLDLGVRAVCMGREFLDHDEVVSRDARAMSLRARHVLERVGARDHS
ncbi:bifunctional 4-hydroxy-2-oxoglutarate aldolase/2-dehydro-3-deoxy-phosphogluconate aldolase [Mycobacterium sp. NPDC003449]